MCSQVQECINPDNLRIEISGARKEPRPFHGGTALLYFAKEPVRLSEAILTAIPRELRTEEVMEEFNDTGIEAIGDTKNFFAMLDAVPVDTVKRFNVVSCWVENSMVGGFWSLGVHETPKRGYVVYFIDDDGVESGRV